MTSQHLHGASSAIYAAAPRRAPPSCCLYIACTRTPRPYSLLSARRRATLLAHARPILPRPPQQRQRSQCPLRARLPAPRAAHCERDPVPRRHPPSARGGVLCSRAWRVWRGSARKGSYCLLSLNFFTR